ncbi:hypothetical protein [Corynebacterium variabile]|uniref:hypothetical protein n=2 Tax=Corynebacterium variabile TaxID=1727 RepID=UPI003F921258
MNYDEIVNRVGLLSEEEFPVLDKLIDALLVTVCTEVDRESWFATERWVSDFTARIKAHYAFSSEPLSREQFETAFSASCEADGWSVTPPSSMTQRFSDVAVEKRDVSRKSISLKTSSAKGMRVQSVHISKLCEAAWIQDARVNRVRRDRLVETFQNFRSSADSIIMLRCFKYKNPVYYELIEIPSDIFSCVDDISVGDAQPGTVKLPSGDGDHYLTIGIDRSDAKITIRSVDISKCTIHAKWWISDQLLSDD